MTQELKSKIITSMNTMLKNTEVRDLIKPKYNKDCSRMVFGYNTNDYTLFFSNGEIFINTDSGLFVADVINL
jgi:hypothetical protein